MSENKIYVSPLGFTSEGTCCCTTISEALIDAAQNWGNPVTIYVAPGIYREKIVVKQPSLTLVGTGDSANQTVIVWGDGAKEMLSDGKRGTFRTSTFRTDTHDFTARNLTFQNDCGPGNRAGQGLAVYADGDCLFFDDCRFLGWQDTLFTAPLPAKEFSPGGFHGPKEFSTRENGRQYYRNCYIEGEVDFIFGSATAYFDHCQIHSLDIGYDINGFATAASTPEGQEYGYVLNECRFTSNCPKHTVYLGRPWREYARTVLLHCELGEHIRPEGWDDWASQGGHDHLYYAEYNSYGPGAEGARPEWTDTLTEEQAAHYRRELVLGDWNPLS